MLSTLTVMKDSVAGRERTGRPLVVGVGLVAWAGMTAAAYAYFWRIDATPGVPAAAPQAAAVPGERTTVLVFLHPKCPCSRATLSELGRVAARVRRPVDFRVLFVVDDADDRSWASTPLYEQAVRLPGVTVAADAGGVRAKQFGVETSGQVVVYGRDGTLRFAGGITGSRGHEGGNAGEDRLLAALNGTAHAASSAPVYGCGLPLASDESPNERAP